MSEAAAIITIVSPTPSRASTVVTVLIVFAPVLIPAAVLLLIGLLFLVLIVVYAFADGFVEGCAALSALIGVPSLFLLWLSRVLRLLHGGR